jgi:hypothetical protein
MNSALLSGRKGQPFSDRDLYDNLSSITIVNYIPLPHIWEEVVHPFIAIEHGLSEHAARADKSVAQEELPRAPSANTNDQPAPSTHTPAAVPVRPSAVAAKPVAQAVASPVKRTTNTLAQAMAAAVKPNLAPKALAAAPATAPTEPLSDEEDGAFEVHFDNLTANKA